MSLLKKLHQVLFPKDTLIYFMYVSTLSLFSDTPEEDLITDGCEPQCGCWDLNSRPLKEQSVLLIAEPSLQSEQVLLNDDISLQLCA